MEGRGKGGGGRIDGRRQGEGELKVLNSGEVQRKVRMWSCMCKRPNLPRTIQCPTCGCVQGKACTWVEQWWVEENLPWNWRGNQHPITVGSTKAGGRGNRARGGQAPQNTPATRAKAAARPNKPPQVQQGERAATEDEGGQGWQTGGLGARQRKRARKKEREGADSQYDGADEGGEEGKLDGQEEAQRTKPIQLPETSRVVLVRRLEKRKEELQQEIKEGGKKSRIKRLEARIEELTEQVKLSGGAAKKRQSFAILDVEKQIQKAEEQLDAAHEEVEAQKEALEKAEGEKEEAVQRLANLRKRLAHITAQKAQETAEKDDTQGIRKAMETLRRMAIGRNQAEVEAVLKYLQKSLPAASEAESDDTLGVSTPLSDSTVAAMDLDNDDLSVNEEGIEPAALADVRKKKRKLEKVQAELREAMLRATQKRDGRKEEGEQGDGEREQVPTLSAEQTASSFRARVKEAARALDSAKADGRREQIPQHQSQAANQTSQPAAGNEGKKEGASEGIARRWETAEERDAQNKNGKGKGGGEKQQQDIQRAKSELRRHTGILRAVVRTNKEIQSQEQMQVQQEIETMAIHAARAHATGQESEAEQAEQRLYWEGILGIAIRESAATFAAPRKELPLRGKGGHEMPGSRRHHSMALAGRGRAPPSSTSSSNMDEGGVETQRRRKDRARRGTSRSPRGYRRQQTIGSA